jgi:hypothetical protein
MNLPTLKAFVLCDNASSKPGGEDQKDLHGAGLTRIQCAGPFPVKLTFWVFIQLSDQKETGQARLAIMRADSGRRYYFRPITIRHRDALHATIFCARLFDCTFPDKGVYFIELWYNDAWLVDQRLEVV